MNSITELISYIDRIIIEYPKIEIKYKISEKNSDIIEYITYR